MHRHLPEVAPFYEGKYQKFYNPIQRYDKFDNTPITKMFGYYDDRITHRYAVPSGTVLISGSLKYPNAKFIAHTTPRFAHASLVINRGDSIEHYDSEGKPMHPDIKALLGRHVIENPKKHQYDDKSCVRHVITRACLSHMDNESYDATIRAAMAKYGLSADAVVRGITNRALEVEPIYKAEPQQSLRFGGLVYGRK